MSENQNEGVPLDPEEAKGHDAQASEEYDNVETNAGDNAKDGGIAESSDQPTQAEGQEEGTSE
jgi:hypothetical protein